jgi:hypothetical protein
VSVIPEAMQDAAFEEWWERFGQPYEAAVIEQGGQPWTTDMDERRELFKRRYRRPTSEERTA